MTGGARRASVKDTAEALRSLSASVAERALRSVVLGPGGCLLSIYRRRGMAPQIKWTDADGEVYLMYHWRVYMYLVKGVIPPPHGLRRICPHPQCVNPDHRR